MLIIYLSVFCSKIGIVALVGWMSVELWYSYRGKHSVNQFHRELLCYYHVISDASANLCNTPVWDCVRMVSAKQFKELKSIEYKQRESQKEYVTSAAL